MNEYTKEQQAEITERVDKAKKMLEELQLQPMAQVQAINVGDDIFAQKVIVYLQDVKYKKK